MNEDLSLKLTNLQDRVFSEKNGKIYIGQEEIKPELLNILKEQAGYLETSQLYEILLKTLKNESANLALIQSKNWEDIQFSKALWHVAHVFENVVFLLKTK